MKKIIKSILLSLFVTLLAAGVVYAACTIFDGATSRTVTEAITVDWAQAFPSEVFPDGEYDVKINVSNHKDAPTQNVKVEC